MPPAPHTTAATKSRPFLRLSRPDLARLWVERLQQAALEERAFGRRSVWSRVGRREDVREVEFEFKARLIDAAEELDEWCTLVELYRGAGQFAA